MSKVCYDEFSVSIQSVCYSQDKKLHWARGKQNAVRFCKNTSSWACLFGICQHIYRKLAFGRYEMNSILSSLIIIRTYIIGKVRWYALEPAVRLSSEFFSYHPLPSQHQVALYRQASRIVFIHRCRVLAAQTQNYYFKVHWHLSSLEQSKCSLKLWNLTLWCLLYSRYFFEE